MGQAVSLGGQKRPASNIVKHRNPRAFPQFDQLPRLDGGGKTLDPEVAGVDFEERCGILRYRAFVVPDVSAVGGANVHEPGPALLQNVGDAEAPADLHRLPPWNNHFQSRGQRRQPQHHRRSVVVDRQRRLSPGKLAQQRLKVRLPRTSPPRPQVQL